MSSSAAARRAAVALGSNVEPQRRLLQAARLLQARFPGVRFSRCYRNAAVGFDGADFYNAAAVFDTTLGPAALVAALHVIEAQCGRGRADPKWAPRRMDIDLLMLGELAGRHEGVLLPRPDLLQRGYMLGPLAELVPGWRHPLDGGTLAELWAGLVATVPPLADSGLDLDLG
ncbi:MAG: 2-amino-4-hydroxy-6-hydroxymethyldihydropteridine diphosphokinase [Gammaproteobacteria bacterium]|nr:2-amino-4-hydroxy-6-hydroxymethyldihydropteridine diphosphokinase [Gammaproteobacteria bacterium]